MEDSCQLRLLDLIIKPQKKYQYDNLAIYGYKVISTKEEQKIAGFLVPKDVYYPEKIKRFGPSVIKPYRDYYGRFTLKTSLIPEEVEVKFAIGYLLNSKVITTDDTSNFGWLRLCTGLNDILYPNLCYHQQLLRYLIEKSSKPRFVITRIYYYLQCDLHHDLTNQIMKLNSN